MPGCLVSTVTEQPVIGERELPGCLVSTAVNTEQPVIWGRERELPGCLVSTVVEADTLVQYT